MFKKSRITTAALMALGGTVLVTGAYAQQAAASDQRVEVTGSRLKRAETEGALPITVIDRAAIEASGKTSVAELMRDVTFSSFGNFKPQSGSSAQALAEIDLRGLGSDRTLVLVDGRRISKAPFSASAQDLNQIPLAAIERVEILSDGASAVYGSDAIGGVINFITRKNFNGLQATYGEGNPDVTGGDTKEGSLLMGASGAKGRLFAGVSFSERGMIYTRDQIGGGTQGLSTFGNNYNRPGTTAALQRNRETLKWRDGGPTGFVAVPGFDCTKNDFWVSGAVCSFNFNASAANEAQVGNKSVFANGEFNINDDWSAYASTTMSNVNTFGRYAATPVAVTLAPTSPAYKTITGAAPIADILDSTGALTGRTMTLAEAVPNGLTLRHRMAAAGPRDTSSDATVSSGLVGVKGRLFKTVDVDVGFRSEKYRYLELGQNYIVRPLLESAISSGRYNIFNPFGNPADVLNGVKSTISRNSTWNSKEMYAMATMDLFKIQGRQATGAVGFETRSEKYGDLYDPQSEAGIIEGSAGNSASGSRDVNSAFFEVGLPVLKDLELSLAGRQDSYTNGPGGNGKSFSPKVAAKWRAMKNLTVRGSVGEGFRAPSLDQLTQKPSFSADSVTDFRTCRAFGGTPVQCGDTNGDGVPDARQLVSIQVDATVIANPGLQPETSKQSSFGLVFDPTNWLSLTLDAYNIQINGRITTMSGQTIINRTNDPSLGPVPAAFSVTRDPVSGQITNITRGSVNEGNIETTGYDLSARTDFKLGAMGRVQNNLTVSVVEKYTINDGDNLVGTQGSPKMRVNLSNTWTYGRFSTNLAINHIDKHGTGTSSTKAYTTANLALTYRHPTKTTLSVGVVNLEGKMPELITYDGRPWNFYLYDALGRQVYVRLQQAF
jgi:iron complex outermembrane receptor protein